MAQPPQGPGAPPPPVAVMQLITGKWISQAVCSAAELGIPDAIKSGPTSADDVAQSVGASADSTYRLMRALTVVGIFVEHEGRRFSNTPLGELLRSDVPVSLRAMARLQGHEMSWKPWTHALHSFRTGESAFQHAYGEGVFSWANKNPEAAGIFHEAMTSMSSFAMFPILASYDFSGFKHIVDVGGGHGTLLAAIVERNPAQRGTLFDLPHATAGAKQTFTSRGLASRVEVVAGDFFTAPVPPGADLYFTKHILHDWSDEACVRILSNISKAAGRGAKVLTFDTVLPPPNVPSFAKLLDLEMLVVTDGGRERTEAEFAALYEKAGLKLTRVIPTEGPVAIVEGVKP